MSAYQLCRNGFGMKGQLTKLEVVDMFPFSHSHRRWLTLGYYWNILELAEFYMFMMFHSPTWRVRRLRYPLTHQGSPWSIRMVCFRASKAGVSGSASSYLASSFRRYQRWFVVQRSTILATQSGIEWINDREKSLVVPKDPKSAGKFGIMCPSREKMSEPPNYIVFVVLSSWLLHMQLLLSRMGKNPKCAPGVSCYIALRSLQSAFGAESEWKTAQP